MSRIFSTLNKQSKAPKEKAVLPNKTLGQNFLKDRNQIKRIIDVSDIKKDDIVLEIGPGLGSLTKELALKAKKVVAIEKDAKLAEDLELDLKESSIKNVQIINSDILDLFKKDKLDIKGLGKYKVVANIPYYLTSFLIRNLLEITNYPKDIFLMIQKEVAQRICSKPPRMNLLAVSVNYYADPKILFYVSKNAFWPKPKVDSAIIRITPKGTEKNDDLFKIVKAGFSHPRKQLLGNLSKELHINKAKAENWLGNSDISSKQRAETLTIADWTKLYSSFNTVN